MGSNGFSETLCLPPAKPCGRRKHLTGPTVHGPTSRLAFAGTKRINSVPGGGNTQKDGKKVERQDDSLKRLETP